MIAHYSVSHLLESEEGPLRRLDARIKLSLTLWLLLLIVLVPAGEREPLQRLAGVVAITVIYSRASFQALALRLLPLLPFLAVVLFIPFLHSGTILWQWGVLRLSETGLERALEVLLRMGAMGLALALLSATTPPAALLDALRFFRVPGSVVQTLEFLFRYLFLLLEEAGHMQRAWRARGGEFAAVGGQRQSLGALVASLFVRTYSRGERVFLAMCSRGYDGSTPHRAGQALPRNELVGALVMAAVLAVIRFVK